MQSIMLSEMKSHERETIVSPGGMPQNAVLMVEGRAYPLRKRVTKIGRKLDNNLVVQDPSVSRYHAEIRYEDGQFVIYDMESSGGTYVNETRVSRSPIFSGDTITLANYILTFTLMGAKPKDHGERKTEKV